VTENIQNGTYITISIQKHNNYNVIYGDREGLPEVLLEIWNLFSMVLMVDPKYVLQA
jgi:hypothetical protein